MRRPTQLPPHLASAPFTVAEARVAGVSPGKLRHSEIVHLCRGIAKAADDGDTELALLVRPYSVVTGYSAASHATAFAIWDFPGFLPGARGKTIHIARQFPHGIPRRTGVTGHRTHLGDDEVECLAGLWITTRIRTWLDCARRMSVDELTVVADHLLRIPRPEFEARSAPYATVEELVALLGRHRGTPGIRKARLALEHARVGSDSAPETRLRLAIVRAGRPEPVLNTAVDLASGARRTPDQSFARYRVAVEYEGAGHSDPEQVARDIAREEDYAGAGWIQVRIAKRHMEHEARAAVAKVRRALGSRGWKPSV
ncbi:hypothetical protein ACQCSX_10715 [Pseudarthrobacter sp. P1]|uniref:hypothetical protein n=1 Tax=Pseudarthrobacter sp. P1 TaxID=3418418 RepID=UPI003CF8D14A